MFNVSTTTAYFSATFHLQLFSMQTRNLQPGNYQLFVNITDPKKKKSYTQTLTLTYNSAHFSFLIQLDKPIYRPGDQVNFRVLAIDSETRPVNVRSATVSILDSASNLVTSLTNITFVKGKYEHSFQLSDYPPMNQWVVRATAESEVIEARNHDRQDIYFFPSTDLRQEFHS